MSDRALVRPGMVVAILAAICCAAPLLAVGLPPAGLGAWLAGAGLPVLPLMVAGLGLVAWASIITGQKPRAATRRSRMKA